MTAVLICVLLFACFDIRLRPVFSLPHELDKADPEQEARYEQCVDQRTDEATRQAFAQADNPDVQNLMIRMRQDAALSDCRLQYPGRQITVREPLRFNLVDMQWRFGDRPRSSKP